jgi:hypothetical protein
VCACRALVEEDPTPCSICGVGLEVGAPDNTIYSGFENSIVKRLTCQDYEYAAASDLFGECRGAVTIPSGRCDSCPATSSSPASPPASAAPGDNATGAPATSTQGGGPTSLPPLLPAEAVDSSDGTTTKSPKGTKEKGMMKKKDRVLRRGSETW